MSASVLDRRRVAPLFALAVLAVAILYSLFVSDAVAARTLQESGPVEATTPYLHFLASLLALIWIRVAPSAFGLLALGSFLMGARELDWHKAFTAEGLFTTKLYFGDAASLTEKILAGAAVLVILGLLAWLLMRSLPLFRTLWKERAAAAVSLLTIGVSGVVLKLIDGAPRMLGDVGVILAEPAANRLLSIEEIGELALPLAMILAILQLARRLREGTPLP